MEKKILVIDDDEAIRKSLILTFEDEDYKIDVAESGKKGLQMFKATNYDLIFLDLKMPGMNGCETLQEIRKLDDVTPIYIITAFHQEFFEYLKEATEQNLDFELLHKPVDSEILLKVVKGILDKPGSL